MATAPATNGDHHCHQWGPPLPPTGTTAATNGNTPLLPTATAPATKWPELELQVTTIAARKGGDCSERLPAVLPPVYSQAASRRRVLQQARSGATMGEQCCCWRWSTVLCQVVDHASIGGLWCYRPEQRMMQVAAGVAATRGL
jgi:hypothetical protein